MRVLHVVGARPNYMKIAPIMRELARYPGSFEQLLVHTGQHYDDNMSAVFFGDLKIPRPDVNLEVGSGSHAWQTAQVMLRFEPIVGEWRPDWVVVVGDVNSTLACALVCSKLGIRVAHVESGLRSHDWTMPEEINRVLTDRLSDWLLTPSADAEENLRREGIAPSRTHFVGNIMIDSLVAALPLVEARSVVGDLGLPVGEYILVTLHRPSNVDDPATLAEILAALLELAADRPVVFPVHPRTRARIEQMPQTVGNPGLRLIEPLGYLDFVALERQAAAVLTDSGGIQEETTYLGIPCLTVRPNTERPITITQGTNRLVGHDRRELVASLRQAIDGRHRLSERTLPELWDGNTAGRIVSLLLERGQ